MKIILFVVGFLFMNGLYAQECGEIATKGVIDGDTIKALISGLPDQLGKVYIRIKGVDAPEIHSKCANEKRKALESKTFLIQSLTKAKQVEFKNMKWDKYGGRILAEVFVDRH